MMYGINKVARGQAMSSFSSSLNYYNLHSYLSGVSSWIKHQYCSNMSHINLSHVIRTRLRPAEDPADFLPDPFLTDLGSSSVVVFPPPISNSLFFTADAMRSTNLLPPLRFPLDSSIEFNPFFAGVDVVESEGDEVPLTSIPFLPSEAHLALISLACGFDRSRSFTMLTQMKRVKSSNYN